MSRFVEQHDDDTVPPAKKVVGLDAAVRLPKIYTKTGDDGTTSLACGSRLPKDDMRIESYGAVDELSSALGVVIAGFETDTERLDLWQPQIDYLEWVQERLFTLSSMLATVNLPTGNMPTVTEDDTALLEGHIDALQAEVPELRNFILPGGGQAASYLHMARTICRRAERNCTTLDREESLDPIILPFLNRLSDDLFVMSRWVAYQSGNPEKIWLGRKHPRRDPKVD
jgi:cob(I)alamin adenosyltransferase